MEHLSRHLHTIKQDAEEWQSRYPLVDRFRPSFTAADGDEIATVVMRQISYYYTTKVFVKRQPHTDELGEPYIADRIRNEAAVLQFVAKHTTIPVPEFLDLWVTAQLKSDILPQLRRLRRNFMGSPDPELPVIPPRRFWQAKEKRVWPSMTKDTDEYVLCHTDLGGQNILVDPNTFKIVSILDWETAGFFPQEWELPLWTVNGPREQSRMAEVAHRREITSFDSPDTTSKSALSPASIQVYC
ncbi:hypothetical protein E4U09_005758 [Claviceps aff. purpurea]|uniref:Aminoglycoside phosphotransferase domain-containing protein n=1 Tax=Claviceps aff. purpurea TaxID=1967640 RepID=A0A9P7U0I2_9HYPO|nr:hypothetical protein E4U09_005758 [Claviceps aff. purpurea]